MENTGLPGYVLILVLGLRHGLDPDHIAVIDGLALRSQESNKKLAPWVGSLFALGHGLVVTLIAVAIHFAGRLFRLPNTVFQFLEWLPVILLLMVGLLNLRSLLQYKNEFKPAGWRSRLVPKRIRENAHPLSILLTGVIFALVFDTATQAATWGYASSSRGGWPAALIMGALFTAGMVFTDTLDGFLLNKILKRTGNNALLIKSRRALGWGIVSLAFLVAGYKITVAFVPSIILSDTIIGVAGGIFFMLMLFFYIYTWWLSASAKPTVHGH
jgi:nickel/cobalt transporter (NiCoT) family protein